MSDDCIYLFKTARRPIYRKENLNLLAAERGTVHEYVWNRSWISPAFFDEGSIRRGQDVVFVFTERPFELFVPVRDGEVVSCEWEDTLIRLKVLLNNPVAVKGVDLTTFTHLAKQASRLAAPPEKFVVPKSDGVELETLYDGQEVPGWRRTVDAVLEMSRGSEDDPYAGSVFFRPGGLSVDGGERLPARRIPLETGTTGSILLHFHNPHLSEADVERLTLDLHAPADALEIDAVDRIPLQGDLEVGFRTLEGPDPELRIEVSPAPSQHAWVLQRLLRAGHEHRLEVDRGGDEASADREDLRRLYRLVFRKGTFDADDRLDLLERFAELLPGEHEIAERRALLILEEGREDAAWEALVDLNREMLGDEARSFLFRQRLRRHPEEAPFDVVQMYDLTSERRFDLLLAEMEELAGGTLDRLVPSLVAHLPDPAQRRRIVDRFGTRLTSPEAARETAFNLWATDEGGAAAERAYRYLEGMRRQLGSNDRKLVRTLIELAEAGGADTFDPDLRRVIAAHVSNLVGRDEFDAAMVELRGSNAALGRDDRRKLHHEVADRYVKRERPREAARVLTEFAWTCLRHGQLEDAQEAIERARGLATGDAADLLPQVRQAIAEIEAAWEDVAELVEWRKADEERRRERLRERLLNRTLLIAGGVRNPEWVEHVEHLTGAEVDWCEAFHGDTDDLHAYAERVENGHYALVLHYLQKTGHGTGDVLRPACEAADVPFLHTTTAGRRGLDEALDGFLEA